MSTHRQFDRICAVFMAFAVVLTILFMNGTRLGLTLSVDADAEAHSDDSNFTDNDLKADWDTSGACQITLEGDSATVAGSGAYYYDGNVVIAQSGNYVVSGALSGGSIVVDADDYSKVWILFDGVEIEREDDACLIIDQADKVFLTLAENSENVLTSGDTYSEEALEDNTDGAIFAHDDLTINGSGSLSVTAGYKHGIAANDDLVITGGNIEVTAAKDAIHANDSLRITEAVIHTVAEDDGLTADNENAYIYIKSGDIDIECADEGMIAAGDVTIAGGNITISTGSGQGHHGIKAGGTCTVTDGTILVKECYEGIQAHFIDIQGGDITIYPTDDGMNASSGSSTEDMFGMQGGFGGEMPDMTEMGQPGQMQGMPGEMNAEAMTEAEIAAGEAEAMTEAEIASGEAEAMTEAEIAAGEAETMTEAEEGTTQQWTQGPQDQQGQPGQMQGMPQMGQGQPGQMQDGVSAEEMTESDSAMNQEASSEDAAEETTETEEELPWLHISGGNVLILNGNAMDADGLDSNGDLVISGGDIRISLTNSGNNAIDYASESGGTCTITGGTIIACGSYAMAEGFSGESTQGSILYCISEGTEDDVDVALMDEDGNELLSWTCPYSLSAVTFSCPEMEVGETYHVVVGENSEEVTLSEIAISSGDAESSMFGGTFTMGGGMSPHQFGETQFGSETEGEGQNGGMQPPGEMQDAAGTQEGTVDQDAAGTQEGTVDQDAAGTQEGTVDQDAAGTQEGTVDQDSAGAQDMTEMQDANDSQTQPGQQTQPEMNQGDGESDTSESEDDAVEAQETEETEITTETRIIWGISLVVLLIGLFIAWRYRRP